MAKPKFDDYDPTDWEGDSKSLGKEGRQLLRLNRAESFRCQHCGADVPLLVMGSENRNHCPLCLWSRHVDVAIGDRKATCLASMEPLGLTLKKGGGELMVVHRCCGCGKVSKNRLAGDDNAVAVMNLLEQYVERVKHNEFKAPEGIEFCNDKAAIQKILGV
jgi:hypothetical protein